MGDEILKPKSVTQLYQYLYERIMGEQSAYVSDPLRKHFRSFYEECQGLCDTHKDSIPKRKLLKLISKVKNFKKKNTKP
jgi:hypothetical protein